MKRLAIMAVLLTGFGLTGTSLTNAQDCLTRYDRTKTESERFSQANVDCWVKKATGGEMNLKSAYLKGAESSLINPMKSIF